MNFAFCPHFSHTLCLSRESFYHGGLHLSTICVFFPSN
jgi:hypothetical protein